MKLIIANWGDDCNGGQYTLHSVESLSPIAIHRAIDAVGDPSDTEHVILDLSDQRLTTGHLSGSLKMEMEMIGFVDNDALEDWFHTMWIKYRPEDFGKTEQVFVYLMKDKANGLYKIGKSINPKCRERTLQSEKPSIKMVFTMPEREGFNERSLHREYAECRKRGEWFDLTLAQVRFICHNSKNFDG